MTNRFHPCLPTRFAPRALLAAGLLLAGACALAQTSIGTVKRVQGQPTVLSAAGERPVDVGSAIFEGDRVSTRAGAAVGLTLADGTNLAVGPNSLVAMQTFRFNSTTQEGSLAVDITRGVLRMVTGLLARNNADAVSVSTPSATIGIRGTDFVVDVGDPVVQ